MFSPMPELICITQICTSASIRNGLKIVYNYWHSNQYTLQTTLQKVSASKSVHFVRMQHNKYENHPVCISMSMCYKKYALNKSSRKHYNYCDLQTVLQHARVSTIKGYALLEVYTSNSMHYKKVCASISVHSTKHRQTSFHVLGLR